MLSLNLEHKSIHYDLNLFNHHLDFFQKVFLISIILTSLFFLFVLFCFLNMSTSGLLADLIADGTTEFESTDEKIGSCSMVEVRGAIRKTDQMHVCIKEIKLDMTDKYNLHSVMREIELLSTIKHPK